MIVIKTMSLEKAAYLKQDTYINYIHSPMIVVKTQSLKKIVLADYEIGKICLPKKGYLH